VLINRTVLKTASKFIATPVVYNMGPTKNRLSMPRVAERSEGPCPEDLGAAEAESKVFRDHVSYFLPMIYYNKRIRLYLLLVIQRFAVFAQQTDFGRSHP
jgi:hypothetical protein